MNEQILNNISKDFYYSKLLKEKGYEYVVKAGYFGTDNCYTDEELKETLNIISTPLLRKEEYEQENACIILATGCFNPLTDGHRNMIWEAVKQVVKFGWKPVQYILAPDADTYCATKGDYHPFHERQAIINQTDRSLTVDSWANYTGKDLNFTTIYRRLELYLERYAKKIPIFFVCGGDRADFSWAFGEWSIIVERNGVQREKEVHPDSTYILPQYRYDVSSTDLRTQNGIKSLEKKEVILRTSKESLSLRLLPIIEKYFNKVHINVLERTLSDDTISLDSLTKGKYNLEISRLYNLGGTERLYRENVGFTERPGSPTLLEQIKAIPEGEYYLFDDDVFTGSTVKFATDSLITRCKILGVKTLVNTSKEFEVLDLRDFRFSSNSGLCVRFPDGEVYRVPYLAPFVDLYQRASIVDPLGFSEEIWSFWANSITYQQPYVTIDRWEYTKLYIKLGFDPKTTLAEVAKYYANVCRNAKCST